MKLQAVKEKQKCSNLISCIANFNKPILRKAGRIFSLIRQGQFKEISSRITNLFYRSWKSFGLRRDLNKDFVNPAAKIQITVRELLEDDIPKLFDPSQAGLSAADIYELSVRKKFLSEKLGKGYVAVNTEGEPCYLQFLMSAKDNERIQVSFDRRMPWLKEDEALIENAFTPPRFRGLGIMPSAMAQIAGKAREFNARWVVTFVAHDNIPSLKGCNKAGFFPYIERRDKWFLHPAIRSTRFRTLADPAKNSVGLAVASLATLFGSAKNTSL